MDVSVPRIEGQSTATQGSFFQLHMQLHMLPHMLEVLQIAEKMPQKTGSLKSLREINAPFSLLKALIEPSMAGDSKLLIS
jgi:hypothetical protein